MTPATPKPTPLELLLLEISNCRETLADLERERDAVAQDLAGLLERARALGASEEQVGAYITGPG